LVQDAYAKASPFDVLPISYLGALTLVQDAYARERPYGVLPTHSSTVERQYFLYRVSGPHLALLREGDSITFDARGNQRSYLGTGWSQQEPWGRWTDGQFASLLLPFLDRSSALNLRIEVRAFNCADVIVRVNGEVRTRWSFSDCQEYVTQGVLLTPNDLRLGTVTVSFEMPGVRSPHDTDPALTDTRRLGISIRQIIIEKASSPSVEANNRAKDLGLTIPHARDAP
jgi:hypothetical protein